MSDTVIKALLKLYAEADPLERCGLVLTDGAVVEITNVHEEPSKGFRMDPEQLLKFVKANNIKATWHTHPDADPNLSQEDYAGFMQWPDLTHLIAGTLDGKPKVEVFQIRNGLVVML